MKKFLKKACALGMASAVLGSSLTGTIGKAEGTKTMTENLTTAFSEVSMANEDSDKENIQYEDEKDVFCWIDNIRYHLKKDEHTAYVLQGRMEGDNLNIPAKVEFEGEEYIIIEYWTSVWDCMDEVYPTAYKHISFPNTIETINLEQKYFPNLESFNIPDSVNVLSIKVDFRKVKAEISENHPKFIIKNHALYLREQPTVLYELLDVPEEYTVEEGTTKSFGFYKNYYVKTIDFPATLEECGSFSQCRELEDVDLSKTKIDKMDKKIFEKSKACRVNI